MSLLRAGVGHAADLLGDIGSPVSGSVSAPHGWGSEQFSGTDLQGLSAALYRCR